MHPDALGKHWIGKAARAALDALLPHRCAACGDEVLGPGFCAGCFARLTPVTRPYCAQCCSPFETPVPPGTRCAACHADPPPWTAARSVWRYDESSGATVLALKYGDRLELADLFAGLLARTAADLLAEPDTVLIPVPLHWRRLVYRRYNQAALIASALSRRTGMRKDTRALVRRRATVPQQGLSRAQRLVNLEHAFTVPDPQRVSGRRLLLVDDVYTTGATASAATRALLGAGAARVDFLCVARVVLPRHLPI